MSGRYANAINRLISDQDLRRELSFNSRRSAMRFSYKKIGKRLLAIYEDLV